MFFAQKLVSIPRSGLVLEVGPGGHPHPRSDILLEKRFSSEEEAFDQRGCQDAPVPVPGKTQVYFDGTTFPFADRGFSYVICSHVLEHVPEVETFSRELFRVAPRGYLEFPTVFYDFLYNFPSHRNLLFFDEESRTIHWLPKADLDFNRLRPVQRFFYESLRSGMEEIVWQFTPLFVQGFEFDAPPLFKRVSSLDDLLPVSPERFFGRKSVKEQLLDLARFNVRKLKKMVREVWRR
jgi:hypothetical protein